MCTRRQAIDIIVKEKQGTIESIKSRIGDLYESFVTLGFISERLTMNAVSVADATLVECEATQLAERQSKFYSLLPA